MRATIAAALAAAMLWAGPASATWTPWQAMDPEDGRIALGGGIWDNVDYDVSWNRERGRTLYHEWTSWRRNGDPSWAGISLYWTDETNWGVGANWFSRPLRKSFVENFGLDEEGARIEGDGPVIGTALGDLETVAFDLFDPDQECLGFSHFWKRTIPYSLNQGYRRVLHVYVCAAEGSPMTEWRLVETLRDLSIEGEFDALVE